MTGLDFLCHNFTGKDQDEDFEYPSANLYIFPPAKKQSSLEIHAPISLWINFNSRHTHAHTGFTVEEEEKRQTTRYKQ